MDNTQDVNPQEGKTNEEAVKAGTDQQPVGPDASSQDKDTANKTGEVADGDDALIRLKSEHEKLQKRYKDAERKITELGQDRSHISRSFETLTSQITDLQQKLATATKKPLPSKEQFIAELQAKGVEALMPYIQEPVAEMKTHYENELSARDERELQKELRFEKFYRENDTANYPGFKELWPEMQRLARDSSTPVNYEAGVGTALDALYKLARADHSGDAILEAEKAAKEKAEANLAKEANSGVASGGKKGGSTSLTDKELRDMPLDKLREAVSSLHGVADRD